MPEQAKSPEYQEFIRSTMHNYFVVAMSILFLELIQILHELEPTSDKSAKMKSETYKRLDQLARNMTPEEYGLISLELVVSRTVEAFEHYLARILFRVFSGRPETLRTSERVTLREVLESATLDEFIQRVSEKKATDLTFGGLKNVVNYLNEDLGLNFPTDKPEFRLALEAIEVRNIIAHNAGRVSKLFITRTKREDLKEGARFPLTQDYVAMAGNSLVKIAEELEARIVGHFRLAIPPSRPSPNDSLT